MKTSVASWEIDGCANLGMKVRYEMYVIVLRHPFTSTSSPLLWDMSKAWQCGTRAGAGTGIWEEPHHWPGRSWLGIEVPEPFADSLPEG